MEKVKELLIKHDYITTIKKTSDGCIVTYPYPKLLMSGDQPLPRLVECFAVSRGGEPGLFVSTSFDKDGEPNRFVSMPEYAIRLYIICEVFACNSKIMSNPYFTVYIDETGTEKDGIQHIIGPPSDDKNCKLEELLFSIVVEARDNGFPPSYVETAESCEVKEGYLLIRSFYA